MDRRPEVVRQLPSDPNYPFLFLDAKAPIAREMRCVYVAYREPNHTIRNLAIKKFANEEDPAAREDTYCVAFERFKKHERTIVITKKTCGDMQLRFIDGRSVPILDGLKTLNLMDPGNVACTFVPFQSVLDHLVIGPLLNEKWPALTRHVQRLEENLGKEAPPLPIPSLDDQIDEHARDVQAKSKSKGEAKKKGNEQIRNHHEIGAEVFVRIESADGNRAAVESSSHGNGKSNKKRKDEESAEKSDNESSEPETKKSKPAEKKK